MMIFKLEKPDLARIEKENISKVFEAADKGDVFDFVKRTTEVEYLYWDKVRSKEPSPENVSKEELWLLIKFIRESQSIKTIIRDKNNKFFTWSKLSYFEKFFNELDMNTGGELFASRNDVEKKEKQKWITRGIMEEAIASSQLEGAATTRQAAKKMLREGRKPKNKSEQMIVNSYLSMKSIEDKYKDEAMSLELLLELHGQITDNTIDSEGERPRMRKQGDPVFISDEINGYVYHEGPEADFVKKELNKLIMFANDEAGEQFIHPIIKAIMLHFWIGYLHPFTDGNGRLARLIFYWYLIKKGYWAFAYLPISKVIKRAPMQYIMAYVHSEQDDNDLNYFIDYNVKRIESAVKEFKEYLDKQSKENLKMKKKCDEKYNFNSRQVILLQYFFGDVDGSTTISAHMNINQVSRMTANNDLKDLVKKGFILSRKKGRNVSYHGTDKIKELF